MEKIRRKERKGHIEYKSHAKINLFLDVLTKRQDGYHNIRTIFSEIEIYDLLSFSLTKKGDVRILSDKDFVSVEKNLIYKVALFIKDTYQVKDGVEVTLKKNIPIAAGLGGGSSNAAVTILALNELWNLKLQNSDFHEIAEKFGSDINFFLEGGTALGEERGNKITPLDDLICENIFLVNPGFGISSKDAYDRVELSSQPETSWQNLITSGNPEYCYNKLEAGIRHSYPEIAESLNFMKENGATNAMLSGSGPTMIGFCPDRQTAEKFAEYFSKKRYWNCITKTIKRRSK